MPEGTCMHDSLHWPATLQMLDLATGATRRMLLPLMHYHVGAKPPVEGQAPVRVFDVLETMQRQLADAVAAVELAPLLKPIPRPQTMKPGEPCTPLNTLVAAI